MQYKRIFAPVVAFALSVVLVVSVLSLRPADARAITGSFLVMSTTSGDQSLYAIIPGGVFQVTSQVQPVFMFSDETGTWERTGPREITATTVDFDVDTPTDDGGVARITYILTFDAHFETFTGSASGGIFALDQDPLDADEIPVIPIDTTVTGRRIPVIQ